MTEEDIDNFLKKKKAEKEEQMNEKFKDKPLSSYGYSMSDEVFDAVDTYEALKPLDGKKQNLKETLNEINEIDVQKNSRQCKITSFKELTYKILNIISDRELGVKSYEKYYQGILLSNYFSIEDSVSNYEKLIKEELYVETETNKDRLEDLIILTADYVLISKEIIKTSNLKDFKKGFFQYVNIDGKIDVKNQSIEKYNKELEEDFSDESPRDVIDEDYISSPFRIQTNSFLKKAFLEYIEIHRFQMESLEEELEKKQATSISIKSLFFKKTKNYSKKIEILFADELELTNSRFLKELSIQLRKTREQMDKELIKFLFVKRGFKDKL